MKSEIEGIINCVHRQLDVCPSSYFIRFEKDLQHQYSTGLEEDGILWFQKSKEIWIIFGNRNTNFFLSYSD